MPTEGMYMRTKQIILSSLLAAAVTLSGCDMFLKDSAKTDTTDVVETVVQVTPTEAPQPTTPPVTVTPMPTSTPAPRLIGTKTTQSKYVFLTNSTNQALRQVFLKETGTEDWGKNLVPSESTIKAAETVQMFYTELSTEGATYDIKIVDKSGNTYAIYGLDLSDMENAVYKLEDGYPYITYLSLSTKSETYSSDSEILAQDYSSSTENSSQDSDGSNSNGLDSSDTTWDYESEPSSGSTMTEEEYLNADAPTDYDPTMDYSDYEGNPNYGYYSDYGEWISYY